MSNKVDNSDQMLHGHWRWEAGPLMKYVTNSNKIRRDVQETQTKGIVCVDFLSTMTGEIYLEPLKNTKKTPEEYLAYFGAVFFVSGMRCLS